VIPRALLRRTTLRTLLTTVGVVVPATLPAQAPSIACHPEASPVAHRDASGLAYASVGCGPPVVVLHGFSADRHMWDALVPHWRGTFRLLLVDLPSHGASAPSTTRDDPAAAVLAILDAQRIERVAVIGHSAGAALAVALALRAPDRVAALVLLSPSIDGLQTRARVDLSVVAARVRAHDRAGAAEAWLSTPVMRTTLAARDDSAFRAMIRRNAGVWDVNASRPAPPPDSAASRIAALRTPILLAVGGDDPSGSVEVADVIQHAHPAAALRRLDGRSHWFPLEVPRVVADFTTTFLRGFACDAAWRTSCRRSARPTVPTGRFTDWR